MAAFTQVLAEEYLVPEISTAQQTQMNFLCQDIFCYREKTLQKSHTQACKYGYLQDRTIPEVHIFTWFLSKEMLLAQAEA
jgi:hypothetical protein